MVNDGDNDIAYSFGNDEVANARLSRMLNEACHVFRRHPDGQWKTHYKPEYVSLLMVEISKFPSLPRKLLALKDPVISNITYSAIESLK